MSTIAYNLRTESPSSVHLEDEHARRRHRSVEHPSSEAQHWQAVQWFGHNCRGKCSRLPSFNTPAHCTFAAFVAWVALVLVFTVYSSLLWCDMCRLPSLNHRMRAQFLPHPSREIADSLGNYGSLFIERYRFRYLPHTQSQCVCMYKYVGRKPIGTDKLATH